MMSPRISCAAVSACLTSIQLSWQNVKEISFTSKPKKWVITPWCKEGQLPWVSSWSGASYRWAKNCLSCQFLLQSQVSARPLLWGTCHFSWDTCRQDSYNESSLGEHLPCHDHLREASDWDLGLQSTTQWSGSQGRVGRDPLRSDPQVSFLF